VPPDFHRYLRAKRSVDDSALDRGLIDDLRQGLAERAADREGPLRVLDVGAGLGTMLARFLEWDVLPTGAIEYTAVDVDPAPVAAIPDHLSRWAVDRSVEVRTADSGRPDADTRSVELAGAERRVVVEPVAADAVAFGAGADRDRDRDRDLLVGAALLDLVALERLPLLLSALAPGSYWYFPITFDGVTRFLPPHHADDAIERAYHRHMDKKPGGDSRAGSHALARLTAIDGATVTGVAGSDWVVRPVEGSYPGDEAVFLRHILDTVASALGDLDSGPDIEDGTLAEWLSTRRRQVANGELTYLTHQLDLLGQYRGVAGETSG
jgi:SAM-dependent methyltransferase